MDSEWLKFFSWLYAVNLLLVRYESISDLIQLIVWLDQEWQDCYGRGLSALYIVLPCLQLHQIVCLKSDHKPISSSIRSSKTLPYTLKGWDFAPLFETGWHFVSLLTKRRWWKWHLLTKKGDKKMWYGFYLVYSLSGWSPLQPSNHVVKKLNPQGQARARFISPQTHLRSQLIAIINSHMSHPLLILALAFKFSHMKPGSAEIR